MEVLNWILVALIVVGFVLACALLWRKETVADQHSDEDEE